MSSCDESQKITAIATLAENFGKELSPGLCSVWLDLLAPYPVALVKKAVRAVIERYEFKTMPPFAVLKKELDALTGTGEQAIALQAEAEWRWLLERMPEYGSYQPPMDIHPTTAYVLRVMGGWAVACLWEDRNLPFKHRDFCEFWKQFHGKTEFLALGAEATRDALMHGAGPMPISAALSGTMRAIAGQEQGAA